MADFELTIGDTPTITITCENGDGTIANLTGASAVLTVRDPALSTATISAAVTIATDPTTGQVSYTFGAGDFTQPGFYVATVKATFSNGSTQTFPDGDFLTIEVSPSAASSPLPAGFGASFQTLLAQTMGYLNGRTRNVRNKLSAAIGPTDTELVLTNDAGTLQEGSKICLGLEVMYVWKVTAKTVTVERAQDGSVALAHDTGALIEVDPEYTAWSVFDAVNAELKALSSAGLWQTKTLDRTLEDDVEGYDLADDVLRVLDVRWQHSVDSTDWTRVDSWVIARDLPATSFPSGVGLMIPRERRWWLDGPGAGRTLRITYAAPLTTLSTGYDDIADTGIPDTALDILPLGAAIRVGAGRPVQRVATGAQPDPRDTTQVRVSDVLNAWAALRSEHDKRVQAEADRLRRQWPYRQPTRTLTVPGVTYRWGWGIR